MRRSLLALLVSMPVVLLSSAAMAADPPQAAKPIRVGLIGLDTLMKFLDAKPADFNIVLTGRGAPPELIERADLVTEMREIKHPYQKGIFAQKGIDF